MTYRALFGGKLTELHASTGVYVKRGALIATVRWKSAADGAPVEITAPADGTVEIFVQPNSEFLQGEPLFRVDPDSSAKSDPADGTPDATIERALAAAMQNDWEYAGRLCKQVLDAHPTSPATEFVALKYRALALGFVGYKASDRMRLDEALIDGRKAVQVFQRSGEPQQNLAGAYKAIGNAVAFIVAQSLIRSDEWTTLYPEGIAALKKAVELDPKDEQARKHLGILYGAEQVAKMHGAKTKSGGCFIATAACGQPSAPEVLLLSAFRDHVLCGNRLGRGFVRLYYAVSPPIAAWISRHNLLRRAAMVIVIRPAVALVRTLFRTAKERTDA